MGERSFRGASGKVKGFHSLAHFGERSFGGASCREKRPHPLVHLVGQLTKCLLAGGQLPDINI